MQSFHGQIRVTIYNKCAQKSLQECVLHAASYFLHKEWKHRWWQFSGKYSHCYCTQPTLQFLIHGKTFLSLISSRLLMCGVEKWCLRFHCLKKQLCLEMRNIMKTEFKEKNINTWGAIRNYLKVENLQPLAYLRGVCWAVTCIVCFGFVFSVSYARFALVPRHWLFPWLFIK